MKKINIHYQVVLFITSLIFVNALFLSPVSAQQGGVEQPRKVPGLDIVILVDESETMWNTTDTEGVRVNTVNFFIDLLSSEQSSSTHRLGIIAFGTEPRVIPYTLLDSQTAAEELKAKYAAVHQNIEYRKNQEYTDINKALRAALEMIQQEREPDRKIAIILVSDGQPTNAQVSEEQGRETVVAYLDETRGLLEQLRGYPYVDGVCPSTSGAPLYMVGIGIDKLVGSSSPDFIALYREFWQGTSSRAGGYYKEAKRIQEMQGISTYIFSELLCTPATPSVTMHSTQVLEYQVYSNYYQIFFTISGKENPELESKIFRPQQDGKTGGAELEKDSENVTWQSNGIDYEVWSVKYTEPWAGTWRIVLEGEGRAEFTYIFFPSMTLDLTEPSGSFLPADRPVTIRARVVDEDGQSLDVPVKDFQVEIEGEDNFKKQLTLKKDGDTFAAQFEAPGQTGEYSLTLHALLPDGTPLYEHKWITLISAPWVEITEPARGVSYTPVERIPLQATVHLAGATSFEDIKLIVTLLKDGQPQQTVEMSRGDTSSQDGENLVAYSGAFRPVQEQGAYAVRAEMMAILPGGRVFNQETASLPLSITAPPTPTLSPSPSPTPTPTPTATPVPATAEPPTPTPTPISLLASIAGTPYCLPVGVVLLLLALILALIRFLRRRWRRRVPERIKLLADLMRSRQESGEPPYILILGSGPSVALGSNSMKRVVKAVSGGDDLGGFYETLDGLSPVERYVMLKKHFDEADVSSGHRRLAQLVEKGFFNLILTTNFDPFLEQALADGKVHETDFATLVCGEQRFADIVELLENEQPAIKIVKLHGDLHSRSFAFTPSEISLLGSENERALRRYLHHDLIVVGYGPRDYDVNRAIEREGGSIWYVDQNPPAMDSMIYQAMRARGTQANVISGQFGLFDRFFEALYYELMHS